MTFDAIYSHWVTNKTSYLCSILGTARDVGREIYERLLYPSQSVHLDFLSTLPFTKQAHQERTDWISLESVPQIMQCCSRVSAAFVRRNT